MIAFFDASALIYLIEGQAPFAARVRTELADIARAYPGIGSALSRLSWLECRAGPMTADDDVTLSIFDAFFARPDLVWVELDRSVVELILSATSGHRFKRHLACRTPRE